MTPCISEKLLYWLENNPKIFFKISRGIERETLRIDLNGNLSKNMHPLVFGSPLTHKWITTDFAETLLEFITPVHNDINHLINILKDIHRYVSKNIKEEIMWPYSIPFFTNFHDIQVARYGNSNFGKLKTIYRKGLKTRYGSFMQTISGVHYNFSLPILFWKKITEYKKIQYNQKIISCGYLSLIRNYYRFGWMIPYLFGASPCLPYKLIKREKNNINFLKKDENTFYMKYSTSLRLSDLGYTNKRNFFITFNDLSEYINILKKALHTPVIKYQKIGIKNSNGEYIQLNCNILQLENELYSLIRPKRQKKKYNESNYHALNQFGIEYIEIRALDINPFSCIGISKNQIRLLDLFLIWCILIESPKIKKEELYYINKNWNRIILEGRKPDQTIFLINNMKKTKFLLSKVGKNLFNDFRNIAKILDSIEQKNSYQYVCDKYIKYFENPNLTYSGKIMKGIKEKNMFETGLILGKKNHEHLIKQPLKILNEKKFLKEAKRSKIELKKIKSQDTIPFQSFLLKNYLS